MSFELVGFGKHVESGVADKMGPPSESGLARVSGLVRASGLVKVCLTKGVFQGEVSVTK